MAGEVRRIDLLRLTVGTGPAAEARYAHSYIGVGLTPVVAVDLEKGGKGSWREIVSVVRGFSRFRPFPIRLEDGRRRRIDSLVFANIAEMAKYARLSEGGRPDDGRFEVITQRQTGKLRVLATAIRAATRGLGPQPSATHYAFTTLAPMPLQLDGELIELDADTPVAVDIAPSAARHRSSDQSVRAERSTSVASVVVQDRRERALRKHAGSSWHCRRP